MTFTGKALLGAFLLGTATVGALPAAAQQQAAAPKLNISNGARPAVKALQDAVAAKNYAGIDALVAAANAKASTAEDRYAIGRMAVSAGLATKNDTLAAAGIQQTLASGLLPADQANVFKLEQARIRYRANDYTGAITVLEPLANSDPALTDAALLLSDSYNKQKQPAQAYAALQKAVAANRAAGRPIPAEWLKQSLALAYNGKLPGVQTALMDWIRADPKPENFRDAARIYAETRQIPNNDQIDLYRLQRAAGVLKGESDFFNYSNAALLKGFPGEAKAVLDEGFASGAINKSRPAFRDVYTTASSKVAADQAALASTERTGLAAPTARQALVAGDVFLGYGDYAKAAALYRAALTKSGADKDLTNLRLGMALARAGDKAGAAAALQSVGGTQQGIAQLWQAWAATR